ncbi:MAG: complex I subunit 1 family protein [Polyangiaceae bacterium]
MTTGLLISFVLKATFVVLFGMNVAVILTWVDRRQGAVIADRIGPNRAVIWLPQRLAQGLVAVPALGVAALVIAFFVTNKAEGIERLGRAILFTHLAILATWLTGLFIAGRVRARGINTDAGPLVLNLDRFFAWLGDPRNFVYGGLIAHAVALLAFGLLRGTASGNRLQEFGYGASPAVLALAIAGGGVYLASTFTEPRVGLRLAGLLHPAADGLKTLWKEDFVPPNADRLLHSIAPVISFFPALVVLAVVPFGDTLCFGSKDGKIDFTSLAKMVPREGLCADGAVNLQVVDVNVGILYFFALAGTGIVGAALAGWASDNKYSLLGGLRAASQMVSYEVTLGLTLIGVIMVYGTLRIDEMVRWQAENTWGIFVQPLAFFLFFAASVAESKRIPFDIPEGESEIVAGYFTEYSGMKFAMFFFAEYVAVVSASALMSALFLGGWHLPFIERDGLFLAVGDTVLIRQPLTHVSVVALGVLAFIGKTLLLCWLQITIRWTLPRFRYDQLMRLGWRKLLPASLVNILITGLVILVVASASPSVMNGLRIAGDVTQLVVAGLGLVAIAALIRFLLAPAEKRRLVVSTAQKFAASLGGVKSARMGA